jgi:hypothetical protein
MRGRLARSGRAELIDAFRTCGGFGGMGQLTRLTDPGDGLMGPSYRVINNVYIYMYIHIYRYIHIYAIHHLD